jgi:glycosyltransferase involved in cell wall biosynthesis
MPEISILLPTYNGARFLRDQIDSILSQDFPHFELLVVDDGSADDSVAILDSYRARDSRVIRLESQGNRGQVSRLKELLAASSGALVAFADQDDVWDRSKLRLLRAAIGDYPLAFGNSRLIDENGQSLGKTLMEALRIAHRPDDRLGIILSARVSAHAMLRRHSIVDEPRCRFRGRSPVCSGVRDVSPPARRQLAQRRSHADAAPLDDHR